MSDKWRVDVRGYPITVLGEYARDFLDKHNSEYNRMKMALHRILKMDVSGGEGAVAQAIARKGLGIE